MRCADSEWEMGDLTPDLTLMIWASARIQGWQLVTRNTKDFPPEWAGIRLPYTL